MHHALLLGVGLTFTSVLLFLPVIYMQQTANLTLSSDETVVLLIPCAVLLLSLFIRRAWLELWLFPCSHLPALVTIPELSGTQMYQGWEGVGAFAVVVVVGGVYFSVAQNSQPMKPIKTYTRAETESLAAFGRLRAVTHSLVVLIMGSFLLGIFLNASDDRLNPTIAALTGLCTLWLVLRQYWYPLLVRPLSIAASRDALTHDVLTVQSVSRQQLLILFFLVLLTLSMLLVFAGIIM